MIIPEAAIGSKGLVGSRAGRDGSGRSLRGVRIDDQTCCTSPRASPRPRRTARRCSRTSMARLTLQPGIAPMDSGSTRQCARPAGGIAPPAWQYWLPLLAHFLWWAAEHFSRLGFVAIVETCRCMSIGNRAASWATLLAHPLGVPTHHQLGQIVDQRRQCGQHRRCTRPIETRVPHARHRQPAQCWVSSLEDVSIRIIFGGHLRVVPIAVQAAGSSFVRVLSFC
jgi:hypothetical protein